MSVVIEKIIARLISKKEKIYTAIEPFITKSNNDNIGINEAIKYILEMHAMESQYESFKLKSVKRK